MSPGVLDHFQNPRNVGELGPPAITVEAMNPVCGDILRVSALVQSGVITDVRYKVRGCTASIAAGSALTEIVIGKSAGELRNITAREVDAALGGLANESKHAAVLCEDAVALLRARI